MLGWSREVEQAFHERLAWAVILSSIPIFFVLLFVIPSPYGKTLRTDWYLGPHLPARACWFLFETPNLIWCAVGLGQRMASRQSPHEAPGWPPPWPNFILLVLFTLHYTQRTILYPLRMTTQSQPIPALVAALAIFFTTINGYLQVSGLLEFHHLPPGYGTNPIFGAGVCLFLYGASINLQSDATLRRLKAQGEGYQIPRGGWFERLSAPHYFGELLEWTGFGIAARGSLATVAFVIFTAANLIPRGVAHHAWYRSKFPDYPRRRYAVLPGTW